jgi:hypothetical protein
MSLQAYLDNVQAKTGKLAKSKGLVEFKDIIAWLKDDFGLGLGHARAIAHVIRHGEVSETGKKKKQPKKS